MNITTTKTNQSNTLRFNAQVVEQKQQKEQRPQIHKMLFKSFGRCIDNLDHDDVLTKVCCNTSKNNINKMFSADEQDDEDENDYTDDLLKALKRETIDACLKTMRDHLEYFIDENPTASYEEWLLNLHPENILSSIAPSPTNNSAISNNTASNNNSSIVVDHRFYVKDSEHRTLWNDNLGCYEDCSIPIRSYVTSKTYSEWCNDNTTVTKVNATTDSILTNNAYAASNTVSASNRRSTIISHSSSVGRTTMKVADRVAAINNNKIGSGDIPPINRPQDASSTRKDGLSCDVRFV